MNRMQSKSEPRSARPAVRRRAAWAFVVLAVVAATLTFWRVQPGEQRGETLAVSVPAASSPAADEGTSAVRS